MSKDLLKFLYKAVLLVLPIAGVLAAIFLYVNFLHKNSIYQNILEGKAQDLIVNKKLEHFNILITGDSRAERLMVPEVFKQNKIETINIGTDTSDFMSAHNAIKKYNLLPKTDVLIMSLSLYQLNDKALDRGNLSPATMAQLKFPELLKLFRKDYGSLIRLYLYTFLKELAPKSTAQSFPDQGFVAIEKDLPLPLDKGLLKRHGWYKDGIAMDGAKLRVFREMLKELFKSGKPVIFYAAPVSPAWKDLTTNSYISDAEGKFNEIIKEEIKQYPNFYFFDFYSKPPKELTNNEFYDIQHTNKAGAEIFTQIFIDRMKQEGLTK